MAEPKQIDYMGEQTIDNSEMVDHKIDQVRDQIPEIELSEISDDEIEQLFQEA